MRLEVRIENEEPVTYQISKDKKLLVGSGESANIHVPAETGVSRKHLEISVENDVVFVTDMGSTNGSYINEERLAPGKKVELTTFFPLKLGATVFISLVGDEDATGRRMRPPSIKRDATAGIDISHTKTVALSEVNRSAGKSKSGAQSDKFLDDPKFRKRKNDGPSDSSRMSATILFFVAILGGGIFYNFYVNPPAEEVAVVPETPPATPPPAIESTQKPEEKKEVIKLVADSEIPTMENLAKAFHDFRCTTTLEKQLCEFLGEAALSPGGVLAGITEILILIPEEKYHEQTFKLYDPNSYMRPRFSLEQRTAYLTALFLKSLPEYTWSQLEKNVFFVFYRQKDGHPFISSVVGMVPSEIEKLSKSLPKEMIKEVTETRQGAYKVDGFKSYMKIIKSTEVDTLPAPPPETNSNPPAPSGT